MSNSSTLSLSQGHIGKEWFATHLAARLQDFFFESSPWQKRLWEAGTLSTLKELLDASFWNSRNVLSQHAVGWLAKELERIVGLDRGIGGRETKKKFTTELATGVPYESRHWRALEQLITQAERRYLNLWLTAVDSSSPPGAERTARAIAALLLDVGFSMPYLHSWIGRHISVGSSVQELFVDAELLRTQKITTFDVVIPFNKMPNPETAQAHTNWLVPSEIRHWLQDSDPSVRSGVRYMGGFRYEILAMDPYAASRIAAGIVDRIIARASYAPGYSKLAPCEAVWIRASGAKDAKRYSLSKPHRGTYVRSLLAERKVHAVGVASTSLDDALELAASLNNSSSAGPAIASGWSALEALLFSPGDPQDAKDGRGVVVAARAATLAACSWPRAELTSLAHAHNKKSTKPSIAGHFALALTPTQKLVQEGKENSVLAENLESAVTNQQRCELVLEHFRSGQMLHLAGASDAAAQERVLSVVQNGSATLSEVRIQIEHAFRRMYRNRNMVVHGGAATAQTLEVALRTSAPLVGAVLDRIAHAQLVDGIEPLNLAARGEISISSMHLAEAQTLSDLLE
ncbi:hypothetical protein [Paeniglutamicibacter kerguelensis]|uniref:Integrase n=1 Tax=Paeniglutamicibacter kerguelensis TaxID=254788 RepID=A0ABS4XIZ6_9MICC|nr:hypothetical protein [Paeniglutamicibacter kerguelensis]MBP2388430.1 hypothetical protein [Paeniglutamicibacter kerguelensis]